MRFNKDYMGVSIKKYAFSIIALLFMVINTIEPAHASFFEDLFGENIENDLSDISQNMVESSAIIPGLITAISYGLALLFGVTGILKLKEHVENPSNAPLKTSMARFIIGGALLALPIVYQAMATTINGGENIAFDAYSFDLGNSWSALGGIVGGILGETGINEDFNYILASIISSVRFVPALITAVAYLLGLLFGVTGLLKLKAHIENSDQNPLKDAVVRLVIGGALFALPNVYEAMQVTIKGDGDMDIAGILDILQDLGNIFGSESGCSTTQGLGDIISSDSSSLGRIMCNLVMHTGAFSAFLTAISYLFGLVLGLWGVLKIQEHVLDPKVPIWDSISRFIAAGAFFTLPFIIEVAKNTVAPASLLDQFHNIGDIVDGFGDLLGDLGDIFGDGDDAAGGACNGLDGMIACFTADIFAPLSIVVKTFSIFAGMVLIMIGISRLMKTAQDGARGPGGIGTMMTFLTGGALISYTQVLGAFTSSFFNISGDAGMNTPVLNYTTGLSIDEIAHVTTVLESILIFMLLIGLISFVRGIFIVRNVAEGNQQASMMAGLTHMAGGALAVNLGPLMNAVQNTLGISQDYGIVFS